MFNEERDRHPGVQGAAAGTAGPAVHPESMQRFDADWYAARYPDVAWSGLSPYEHYVRFGRLLKRPPNSGGRQPQDEEASASACEDGAPAILSGRETAHRVASVGPLRGGFNLPGSDVPLVRGWMARIGDARPRTATVHIGARHSLEVACDGFRSDLLENRINEGRHGFELVLPIEIIDGRKHHLKLIDKESGQLVAEADASWVQERSFGDFTGFLAHSMVSPLVYAPFREEDKRCFAVMENLADHLAGLAEKDPSAPVVSVIMPVHNRQATVAESMASVLDQSHRNIELVVIDDGSTDGTRAILEDFAARDERVVLLRHEACRGVSFARNRGLDRATGEVICYLDSDNTWDRRYLAATVGAFRKLPDARAVYSGQFLFRGTQCHPFAVRFGSLNRGLLENRNYIDLNCFAHKRAVLGRTGRFDETLARFVDWDFILRLSETARMYSVPVLLSRYCLDKAANTLTNASHLLHQLEHVRAGMRRRRAHAGPNTRQAPEHTGRQQDTEKARNISIIIPSYEALPELRECMASIFRLRTDLGLRVIVVDNASGKPVQGYLEALAGEGRIRYLRNPVNYGFTHAVNQGLDLAGAGDDVLLLNNDAALAPDALDALNAGAYSLPQCGITVPRQVLAGGTRTIADHVPYASPEHDCDVNISRHHANVVDAPVFHHGEHTELSFAPFFCAYIRRDVLDRMPHLDEKHGRHYRSDRIYCDYLRKLLGYKIYHVSGATVYHKLQRSTDILQKAEAKGNFEEICIRNSWNEDLSRQLGYGAPVWESAAPADYGKDFGEGRGKRCGE